MQPNDTLRRFFRRHAGAAVAIYPPQQEIDMAAEGREERIEWSWEQPADDWKPVILLEAPAKPEEQPARFIDGCFVCHPVVCLRAPGVGWPVPVLLAEVGGVAMRRKGRDLIRDFYGLERVLSFITTPFPWNEVESFASAACNMPEFPLRVLPGDLPQVTDPIEHFDYEKMRKASYNRAEYEMAHWEAVAFAADSSVPTLVDGRLEPRVRASRVPEIPLLVGVVKTHSANLLHPQGWRTLLDLKPGQRTPYFRIATTASGETNNLPVATWFLKMAGGDEVMPNWAAVRVEVPWVQFVDRWSEKERTGFVNRLSRWLIDARCRQRSYARMPISLEPIVRAEDCLKSLFTPFGMLRNRFLRYAGVVGGVPHG
jgi:hypothetical protein